MKRKWLAFGSPQVFFFSLFFFFIRKQKDRKTETSKERTQAIFTLMLEPGWQKTGILPELAPSSPPR